jgi:hypothetical protein
LYPQKGRYTPYQDWDIPCVILFAIARGFLLGQIVRILRKFWRITIMNINETYEKILELQDQKENLEKQIKDYKQELDSMLKSERDPEIRIIYIPDYVSNIDEYISTRFPIYDLISVDEELRTAKIQEKDSFVPRKIVFDNGGQVYRRISRGKPSVDIESLQKGYPDIYSDLIKMVPEIDEEKFNQRIEEDPEFLNIIEEVIKMEKPYVAVVVSKPKEGS